MKIHVTYFAVLREQRGISEEVIDTLCKTPEALYEHLRGVHNFSLDRKWVKVAVNDEFAPMDGILFTGDRVVFIPPVAGG